MRNQVPNKKYKFIFQQKGVADIFDALKDLPLSLYLARSDIRQRYRRSTLGPFWITISTGVMIGCIGVIFGGLFKSPMYEFLPFGTSLLQQSWKQLRLLLAQNRLSNSCRCHCFCIAFEWLQETFISSCITY